MRKLGGAVAVAAVVSLISAGAASGETLGSIAQPGSSTSVSCEDDFVTYQVMSDPSTPYTVPAGGGGEITAWETNTSDDTANEDLSLLVVRPTASGGAMNVVGIDNETLPATLPGSGVVSFTLAKPIVVEPGDELGLYSSATNDSPICWWYGGSTPESDVLGAFELTAPPTAGATYDELGTSGDGYTMNLAATFVPYQEDVAVTTAAGQRAVAQGQTVLDSAVTDHGPGGGDAITFTDNVPAGLRIDSAVAGDGTCAVAGQTVTCTTSSIAMGQSADVDIVVTPSGAGRYDNTVTVSPATGVVDSNEANNTASATLSVAAVPAAPKCTVPALKGTRKKAAENMLKLLGCTLGKAKKAHSSTVAKGSVISTSPKAGTYAEGKKVTLTVSSGPKRK